MPKIMITEHEDTSFASFDVTENTVAIPVLCAPGSGFSGPLYYTSARELQKDWQGVIAYDDLHSHMMRKYLYVYEGASFPMEEDPYDPSKKHSAKAYPDELIDRSFAMAYELLLNGLNVLLIPKESDNAALLINEEGELERIGYKADEYGYVISEVDYYNELNKSINDLIAILADRNLYNVKFITTGGYANMYIDSEGYGSSMADELVEIAAMRKDAIALFEMPSDLLGATKQNDIQSAVRMLTSSFAFGDNAKYAACFFPHCRMTLNCGPYKVTERTMPASFAYLMAYANSVRTNANWFAASGVTRGRVPNLVEPIYNVGEALMNWLQNDVDDTVYESGPSFNINPIYNAGTYGYRVWGNRVAWKRELALNNMYQEYLNVRVLMCDIKKQIYHAAIRTTFEPNDDIVYYSFKSMSNTLLDKMKSGRGIRWYRWTRERTEEKALIKATLTIQPIEAVESFEINVVLSDEEAEVIE